MVTRMPSSEMFQLAEKHGIRTVIHMDTPFKKLWTSSVPEEGSENAYIFSLDEGVILENTKLEQASAVCIR